MRYTPALLLLMSAAAWADSPVVPAPETLAEEPPALEPVVTPGLFDGCALVPIEVPPEVAVPGRPAFTSHRSTEVLLRRASDPPVVVQDGVDLTWHTAAHDRRPAWAPASVPGARRR